MNTLLNKVDIKIAEIPIKARTWDCLKLLWLGTGSWLLTPALLTADLADRYWGQTEAWKAGSPSSSDNTKPHQIKRSFTYVMESPFNWLYWLYLFPSLTLILQVSDHQAVMLSTLFYPLPWQQRSHPVKNLSVSVFVFIKIHSFNHIM